MTPEIRKKKFEIKRGARKPAAHRMTAHKKAEKEKLKTFSITRKKKGRRGTLEASLRGRGAQ